MHSPAMIVATSKIQDLLSEAEGNRLAKQARQANAPRGGRFAGVTAGFRSLLREAADAPALPRLADYPYRS